MALSSVSRPVRARGLKQGVRYRMDSPRRSRPVRARGLKLKWPNDVTERNLSRPVRARGLKLARESLDVEIHVVAPRAGAWLETSTITMTLASIRGRAPCGRVA